MILRTEFEKAREKAPDIEAIVDVLKRAKVSDLHHGLISSGAKSSRRKLESIKKIQSELIQSAQAALRLTQGLIRDPIDPLSRRLYESILARERPYKEVC